MQVSDLAEWGVGAMAANPDEAIPVSDETRRLAVVDLDWDRIKAVDILVVLRSFAGQGRVERVTVYPSDFGLQRMAEEASMGPQVSRVQPRCLQLMGWDPGPQVRRVQPYLLLLRGTSRGAAPV